MIKGTGFFFPRNIGKALRYQVLSGVVDFMSGNSCKDPAIVLVVSSLNVFMRDEMSKLNERGVSLFM